MLCSPEMRPQTPGAVGLRPAGAPSAWEREGVAISAEGGQEDGAGWGGASHRLACFSPHPVFTSHSYTGGGGSALLYTCSSVLKNFFFWRVFKKSI